MKHTKLFVYSLSVIAALTMFVAAFAQGPGPAYQLIATIPIPADSAGKGLTSWDITWIDPGTQRLYVANRTTTKGGGRIDVIDTQQNKFLYSIPGLAGTVLPPFPSKSGPNGVVAIPQMNQLYVGDGDSTVKVIDLGSQKVIATINTGGTARADELGYYPLDHIILIANASDSPPFVTFISADTQKVVGTYTYPTTQVGIEQPVFSALTQKFYVSIPATASTLGSVDVFDPITMKREQSFAIGCSPAGLVLTPSQHLWTSCGAALNVFGSQLATVGGVGGDQIWYNRGDNRIYFGSAVVDADTNQVVGTLPGVGARVNPAADSETNHVFAPVAGVGIKVYSTGR